MITFEQLQYFVQMVQAGSQTKAAEQLYITRQTISKSIRELETEIGKPLYTKEAGTIQLTAIGKCVYDSAVELVQAFNSFVLKVKHFSQQQFSCCYNDRLFAIMPFIKVAYIKYLHEHEDIIVDMQSMVSMDAVYKSVMSGATDCGMIIRMGKESRESLWNIPIRKIPAYAILQKQHPLSEYEELEAWQVIEYPLVCHGQAELFYEPLFKEAVLRNRMFNIMVEPQVLKASNYMIKNHEAIMVSGPNQGWNMDYPNIRMIPINNLFWEIELIGKKGSEAEEFCKDFGEYLRAGIENI